MKSPRTVAAREPTLVPAWDDLRRRLEAARAALERGCTLTEEAQRLRLQERARALACVPAEERPQACLDVVEFLLAYEQYGIASAYVREVYPLRDYTPLPCTPPFVLGIVNVRGQILSVLDLKKFFDLPDRGLTDRHKVIILQSDHMEFGILADAILGVRAIPYSALQPSLPTLTGVRADYLLGITPEHTAILDAQRLLSDDRLIVREADEWEEGVRQ
jgi:purine-binding chemotaxis protein CheW